MKYIVKTSFNFTDESGTREFDSLQEAKNFLREEFANEIKIDVTETGVPIEAHASVDWMSATLTDICVDHLNITRWEILEKEEKGNG